MKDKQVQGKNPKRGGQGRCAVAREDVSRESTQDRKSNGGDQKRQKRQWVGSRKDCRASGVVSFNWASGFGTCSDNIKGQIYINHCREKSTGVRKGCRVETGIKRNITKRMAGDYLLDTKVNKRFTYLIENVNLFLFRKD